MQDKIVVEEHLLTLSNVPVGVADRTILPVAV